MAETGLHCNHLIEVMRVQVIGIHQRAGDLKVNACKKKAVTNMRRYGLSHMRPVIGDSALLIILHWCPAHMQIHICIGHCHDSQ